MKRRKAEWRFSQNYHSTLGAFGYKLGHAQHRSLCAPITTGPWTVSHCVMKSLAYTQPSDHWRTCIRIPEFSRPGQHLTVTWQQEKQVGSLSVTLEPLPLATWERCNSEHLPSEAIVRGLRTQPWPSLRGQRCAVPCFTCTRVMP